MRLLFFTHEFTRSGAPIILKLLVDRLRRRPGWSELEVAGFGDGPLLDDYRALGVPTRALPLDRSRPYHYDGFLGLLDDRRPDVVLLNGATLYQEAMLAHWKGHRVIWWIHEGIHVARRDGFPFTKPELESFLRQAVEYGHRLVFSARDTRDQFVGFCPSIAERGSVIGYGIDLERLDRQLEELRPKREALRAERGAGPDDFVFLCVGAIQERKNQAQLVEAFQRLLRGRADHRRAHLWLVGGINPTDPAAQEYQRRIEASLAPELASQVHFLGLQPSATPFFVAADCHVLVSTNECSPIANLEAMALGCLCVSSHVHGIPEVVADGERGFLVDPEDADDIATRLDEVWRFSEEAPERLQILRDRARDFVRREHVVSVMTDRFSELIERTHAEVPVVRPSVPVGDDVNRFLQDELVLRWCWAKHEPGLETELVRHRARHLAAVITLDLGPPPGLRAFLKRVLRRLGLVPWLRRIGLPLR